MEDVFKSAPLHDIGKIKVSDRILNKPARLDEEEYRNMKTHTIAGAEIIDQVIEKVPDSDYLNEARNLALYHHERWDGKGYPMGLSGRIFRSLQGSWLSRMYLMLSRLTGVTKRHFQLRSPWI